MRLQGKTALVIGGGTGIGLGIAAALAREGCHTGIAGRRLEKLEEAAQGVDSEPSIVVHPVDVADRPSVLALIDSMTAQLGRIDILVNAAGMNIPNRTLSAMRPEQWDQVLAVNATGAYNCLYAVLPQMRERGDGLVVNISSVAGKRAVPLGGVAYNASKFAMTALGTAAWNEEAEHGIRVTNIYPGEVNTPILDNRPTPPSDEHKASILQPEDFGELMIALALLPPRAHVPEIVIKPTKQPYT
jgi:NAD(P)-dependent dehydrogenase (short-subunit alcohol dehydrogenase family)